MLYEETPKTQSNEGKPWNQRNQNNDTLAVQTVSRLHCYPHSLVFVSLGNESGLMADAEVSAIVVHEDLVCCGWNQDELCHIGGGHFGEEWTS